ncbi:sulfite exporter TauE/SafE family protein [Pseudoroseicyclus aestuarii]|uniref:Probable membrane transporter protein n=1 Tax=Pseudoroseicyclus aestuarii TaxID=1795041 RepID=A0A318SXD8_9RHOB|nr:sulfite exporter TauE/SafE family protein [Pseudoroseicyclus aestuarii]PYE85026.1 hypothetical protein DFP88_102832 [Pseudoroseicyclus aestuarii]
MPDGFLLFILVGFLAQIVDGALGMAYGVVSSSVLLSFGVPPAVASASTHAAEVFTTGASAGSHIWNRNVNWRLLLQLMPIGVICGVAGTYVLTSFDGSVLRPWITAYLGIMGLYILWRAWRPLRRRVEPRAPLVAVLGGAGGFVDAVGGGGWGPVVTTGLIGAGGAPREVIGTVNTAEFVLTVAVSITFLLAIVTGHWDGTGLDRHAWAVAGLILGGLAAAPLAGVVVRVIQPRALMVLVGVLICTLAVYQATQLV